MHLDGIAYGSSAILIKSSIKHHEYSAFRTEHIQATAIVVEDKIGLTILAVIYSLSKHNIRKEQYLDFLR